MRTADLNAELLREISAIISDKELTKKTLEFVRSLRGHSLHVLIDNEAEENFIGKEELKEMLREGLNEVRLIKEGKLKGIPAEEVFK